MYMYVQILAVSLTVIVILAPTIPKSELLGTGERDFLQFGFHISH